jgi:hypothetical protein
MMNLSDALLVSISFNGPDTGVLIVGRKAPKQALKIVNAFQGKEALELYKKLTTVKENKNDCID